MRNLLGDPDPTFLPGDGDESVRKMLADGASPADVAAAHPAVSYPWALLAREAIERGETIAAYAYARTGYHRGLDALRRAGWKGHGPVPASHVPNQGFLISLLTLGEAAGAIGEVDEAERCATFARDCDPASGELIA